MMNIGANDGVKIPAYMRRSIDFKYLWNDILACYTPSHADDEIPGDAYISITTKNV